ncbi:MAG: flavin reductase family protein [Chloroflexota bacterium]|nr:flavin reductase family protein [Chloroflexota bacterium]
MDETGAAFDAEAFGRAVGRFAAGVTVVTTRSALGFRGITASSFSFVSLAPPLVLVCIVATSSSVAMIEEAGAFAVNVLPEDDEFLADRFANRAPLVNATFSGVPYRTATTGAPLLRAAIASFDCRLHATHPGGDHRIFVGEVLTFAENDGDPLLAYRSRYARLTM